MLRWNSSHGQAKVGRPARTSIQQLCANTGCSLEAMDDRDGWREMDREIRASSATWWWWWWQTWHKFSKNSCTVNREGTVNVFKDSLRNFLVNQCSIHRSVDESWQQSNQNISMWQMLYSHIINMLIYTYIYVYILDIYRRNDNRRAKASLEKYVPLTLCKGSKRVTQGFMVRGSWSSNRTAIYWPPFLWPSALCLSRSPGLLNRRPMGPLCWMMAFFTTSYRQLLRTPTQSGAPRAPSAWCGFPYHILSATFSNCLTSCLDWII